jgi:cytochrome b pre-mRNA-processing protein 3
MAAIKAGFWPFGRSRAYVDAGLLLSTVTQISRQPSFFGEGRISDTLEGRLELMTLHACLVLLRMGEGAETAPLGQAFADQLFRQFDAGLREAGVGDLAVPKRMHKIAGGFYGRLRAYAAAFAAPPNAALEEAVARNFFAVPPADAPFAPALAAYARAAFSAHAAAPVESLFRLDGWPPAPH